MTGMSPAQATEALGDKIKAHSAILLFIAKNATGDQVPINNATASLVFTGTEHLLITCAHVVHAFRRKLKEDAELFMAVGGGGQKGVFEIKQEWLVDCGEESDLKIDLATYRLPSPDALAVFGKSCFAASHWPPAKAREGDLAVIAGFPGEHLQHGERKIVANINVIADPITTVRDAFFTLADENRERSLVQLNESLAELGPFGGMSGSAAYVFDSEGRPQLVGFLHETHDGLHALIRVMHAFLIQPNGKLDRGLIPL